MTEPAPLTQAELDHLARSALGARAADEISKLREAQASHSMLVFGIVLAIGMGVISLALSKQMTPNPPVCPTIHAAPEPSAPEPFPEDPHANQRCRR